MGRKINVLSTFEADPSDYKPMHRYPCNSRLCGILNFTLTFLLDLLDFVSDWLLYADLVLIKDGLVYGPPETPAVHAFFVFSIIGTITFIFESVNLWFEVFRSNPCLDPELVSVFTTCLEDLPQIAIILYLAWCREDPISVFQLSRASLALLTLFITIIVYFVKYCSNEALEQARGQTSKARLHTTYRVFIMLGLLINAAMSVTVFVFTQTQRGYDGSVEFKVPKTFFEDEYNDQRYFQNVSIFIYDPDFDDYNNSLTSNNPVDTKSNWVRLMSLNDIRNKADQEISFAYVFEKNATILSMGFWIKDDINAAQWQVSECYTINRGSGEIKSISNQTCLQNTFNKPTIIYITFRFLPPQVFFRQYIFGDIRFNIKTLFNNNCQTFDNFTNQITSGVHLPTIHYFRISSNLTVETSRHLLADPSNNQTRYFRNDGVDLQDIADLWRTGYGRCNSSGSLAPNLDRSISTTCDSVVSTTAKG